MMIRCIRQASARAVLTTALFAAIASTTAVAGPSEERPGVGYTPAFVCLATTVKPDGFTMDSRILRRSGSGRSDRLALRFVQGTRLQTAEDEPGYELFVLIRMHSNGQLAHGYFRSEDALPPICRSPFESVARDREINAATPE